MNTLLSKLAGKKTYIVAAAGIAYTLAQMWSGAVDQNTGVNVILGFLGLGAVRHGVSTSTKG
jgi:hypothetical protein